jgi:hypothetical protein
VAGALLCATDGIVAGPVWRIPTPTMMATRITAASNATAPILRVRDEEFSDAERSTVLGAMGMLSL